MSRTIEIDIETASSHPQDWEPLGGVPPGLIPRLCTYTLAPSSLWAPQLVDLRFILGLQIIVKTFYEIYLNIAAIGQTTHQK